MGYVTWTSTFICQSKKHLFLCKVSSQTPRAKILTVLSLARVSGHESQFCLCCLCNFRNMDLLLYAFPGLEMKISFEDEYNTLPYIRSFIAEWPCFQMASFLEDSTALGLKDTKVCPLFTLPAVHRCPVTNSEHRGGEREDRQNIVSLAGNQKPWLGACSRVSMSAQGRAGKEDGPRWPGSECQVNTSVLSTDSPGHTAVYIYTGVDWMN